MRTLVLTALLALSGCAALYGPAGSGGSDDVIREHETRRIVREEMRQQCIRQQTMRHGMGGPPPDFSTC